jgi:hypothetical protein
MPFPVLESLSAYFLPVLPFKWDFGSSNPERATGISPATPPLSHFGTTTAFCPTTCGLPTRVLRRLNPRSENASPKLLAPSAFPGFSNPSFHLSRGVWEIANLPEVPPPAFGYPLGGVSFKNPLEPFSAPHALGVPPSEPFSFPVVQPVFPRADAFLHFSQRPSGPP